MTTIGAPGGAPGRRQVRRRRRRRATTCSALPVAPEGWWKGELETNVTMDAEDLLLREFLGIRTADETARGGPLDPVAAARRRHLGDVLRRPARTVHHDRGVRRAAAGRRPRRRRAHAPRRRLRPGARRHRGQPRLHPDLAGAVRAVVVGRPARHAARADVPAEPGPAERVRLGVLGAADDRPADDPRLAASRPAPAVRPGRAARRRAPRAGPPRAGAGCSTRSTAPCTCTRSGPCGRCGAPRCAAPPSGSSRGRRPTAAGAASSRRGCTR